MRKILSLGLHLIFFLSCKESCPELQVWEASDDTVPNEEVCPGMSRYAGFNVAETLNYLQSIRLTLESVHSLIPEGALPDEIVFGPLKKCTYGDPHIPADAGADCIPQPWMFSFYDHAGNDPFPHLMLSIGQADGIQTASLGVLVEPIVHWHDDFHIETQKGFALGEVLEGQFCTLNSTSCYAFSYRVASKE
ncbi:MAG TPA: hypothetical protein P5077_00565 [bacterium]|nr:hypothetical protein [bacterium]